MSKQSGAVKAVITTDSIVWHLLDEHRAHWRSALQEVEKLTGDGRWKQHLEAFDEFLHALSNSQWGGLPLQERFLVVQEGASTGEFNVVEFRREEDADWFRSSAAKAGYRTSPCVRADAELGFYREQIQLLCSALASAMGKMDFPPNWEAPQIGPIEQSRRKALGIYELARTALIEAERREGARVLTGDVFDVRLDFFLVGPQQLVFAAERDQSQQLPWDLEDCHNVLEGLHESNDMDDFDHIVAPLEEWLAKGAKPDVADHHDRARLENYDRQWEDEMEGQPFVPVLSPHLLPDR